MKADYPVEWVPATPDYILAAIQEEWRQCAIPDEAEEPGGSLPGFFTTVHQWREGLGLVGWSRLGYALNKQWGTKISGWRWFQVLVPAREKTLREVCNLLATQARQPVFPRAGFLGCAGQSAGVFLAVRSLLIQAGASRDLRPSTSLEPFLRKWPKVFVKQVSELAPGGLPLAFVNKFFERLAMLSFAAGLLLVLLSALASEPYVVVAGTLLLGAGWLGGLFGPTWFPGRLTLENATTFRGLTEIIVEQRRRCGVDLRRP